ncbi:MAG: hypothetical protein K2Z81_03950, partial [Cyanobacteria bacterium]|nr:hypothetical protein [Cyanobacteriota bacterium]
GLVRSAVSAFLVMLIFLILWGIWKTWQSGRDPVSSGPAIVPGGVAPENAPARFQEMGARINTSRTGSGLSAQNFQIISSQVGRMWGVLDVRYANGQEQPRRLNGERAYRAEVRFPDGKTETLYMLQGCGNDLRYDGINRYLPGPDFRFEADPVVEPAPAPVEPQPEPAPVAVEPPAPSINRHGEFIRTKDTPQVEKGILKIVYRPEEGGKDSMVEAEGIDVERFTFTKNGNSITFRFREARTTELTKV